MHDDLTALVIRARTGDEQAWDELVERYAPLVWSICRRYGLGRADAENAGQGVWLRMVDHLASIRDPAALPAGSPPLPSGNAPGSCAQHGTRRLRTSARNPGHDHGSGRVRAAQSRAPRGAARGIHAPASRLPEADRHA